MTKDLKRYLSDVADLGCILCHHLGYGATPAQLHHPRNAAGGGERASDWLVVPLCPEHHTGNSGLHGLGGKGFYIRYNLTEWNLVALTIENYVKSKN